MKTFPIPRRFSRPAIHHQIFRLLRHLGIEVIQQHPQRRLLLPPLARNLRPPRRPERSCRHSHFRRRSWYGHTHEISSPPPILAHASALCTCTHSSPTSQFPITQPTSLGCASCHSVPPRGKCSHHRYVTIAGTPLAAGVSA